MESDNVDEMLIVLGQVTSIARSLGTGRRTHRVLSKFSICRQMGHTYDISDLPLFA